MTHMRHTLGFYDDFHLFLFSEGFHLCSDLVSLVCSAVRSLSCMCMFYVLACLMLTENLTMKFQVIKNYFWLIMFLKIF